VIENVNTVSKPKDLVQVVTHEQDCKPVLPHAPDGVLDPLGLVHAECGRGLVKHNHTTSPPDCASDRYCLALASRQRANFGPQSRHIDTQIGDDAACLILHLAPRQKAKDPRT
jgi:hypothetical protein